MRHVWVVVYVTDGDLDTSQPKYTGVLNNVTFSNEAHTSLAFDGLPEREIVRAVGGTASELYKKASGVSLPTPVSEGGRG